MVSPLQPFLLGYVLLLSTCVCVILFSNSLKHFMNCVVLRLCETVMLAAVVTLLLILASSTSSSSSIPPDHSRGCYIQLCFKCVSAEFMHTFIYFGC